MYNGPRKCGYKTDTWSYTLIHAHAKKKFGMEISYDTIVGNMHELGLAIKSPRTSHPEVASSEERAESGGGARCDPPPCKARLPAAVL